MNPFWSSRSAPKVKKEGKIKNTAKVLSSTANTSVLEQPSLEYSRIKTTDENLNATWISKNGQSTCVEVKEELQCQDDDYIIEFRNQFRDKVVIQCFAKVIEKRNNDITDRVDSSVSNGRVNFKKFRKVLPLHPQRSSIMNQTVMATVTLGSQAAPSVEPVQVFNDNSDGDIANVRPVKRSVKKIVL